jgi:cytoskeletal protein CcmA (bactofilin family)
MWNRRKEEESQPRPSATPAMPAAPDPVRETSNPMSSMPVRNIAEPESPRGSAAIGKSVMVKGQIFSREDIYIDGEVEGGVEAHEHRVTVGPNGKVQANVRAREIVVVGTIHGNVDATDKIDIRKDARLVGDIKTQRIVIEDGAYFKGSIDIQKAEPAKPAPAPAAKPVAAQPVPSAAAASSAPTQVVAAGAEVKR